MLHGNITCSKISLTYEAYIVTSERPTFCCQCQCLPRKPHPHLAQFHQNLCSSLQGLYHISNFCPPCLKCIKIHQC